MSVSVRGVTKLYGSQKALDDVRFEIAKGEIIGFLGPNGAGKSTMMKIITCYLPQTEGQVVVYGHDVVEDSMAVRRHVGYLPEHNPLYLEMYVREYLGFIAEVHKVSNARGQVSRMIEMTGLEQEQKKKIGALSKGYRQRVGLAQALIHDPEVLILDEPTSGLDPNQLEEIRKLIKNVGEEKTVMLSTHIMQEVEAVCDRAIIIDKGKIVADEKVSDMQSKGVRETVIKVEFDQPVEEKNLLGVDGVQSASRVDGNVWILGAGNDIDVRPGVNHLAKEMGVAILTIQKEEKKLEDVFKELTKD
jgi:ABC-2 type transport system ATP-binding protein